MSHGIGPVLLTHFTPDEAEADTVEDAPLIPAAMADTKPGVLVAPAPTRKTARHRAGRGRRALVLTRSPAGRKTGEAVGNTNELPILDQLRNTPKNLRILAMTAGAVVLISIGFGFVRPADQLPGTAIAVPPSTNSGMQPGTLPDAALSGTPTTTLAPPPTTTAQAPTPPPTHHTTTHAAPPPVTSTATTQSGSGFDQPGKPCGNPGDFGIDSNYRPVECAGDASGNLTWHEF
jgi:hypothetical protein